MRLDYEVIASRSPEVANAGRAVAGYAGGSADQGGRGGQGGTSGGGGALGSDTNGNAGTTIVLGSSGGALAVGGDGSVGAANAGGALAAGGTTSAAGTFGSGGIAAGGTSTSGGVASGGTTAGAGTSAAAGIGAGGASSRGGAASGGISTNGGGASGGIPSNGGVAGGVSSGGAATGGASVAAGSPAIAGAPSYGGTGNNCQSSVDLFPTPVTDKSTLFPDTADGVSFLHPADDAFMQVNFGQGFTFRFYGVTYTSIYLNTNGGLTFGGGEESWSKLQAVRQTLPAIGVIWGDMNASDTDFGANRRPEQMLYQQCADRFVVTYKELQEGWTLPDYRNTATVSLFSDGTIVVEYGSVMSNELLVGLFSGAHANDQYVAVQSTYWNYAQAGSSIVLFDGISDSDFNPNPIAHQGELSNRTVTYVP